MPTSVTLHGSWFPETPRLLAAFLLVFALGGSGGFVVRAVSLPAAPSSERVVVLRVTEPCPAGQHVVVWYSAHAWGCVS